MDLSLKDKVVLVTGGTGDIGRAVIKAFIEEGAKVAFTYNSADNKSKEIKEEFGDNVLAFKVPATDFNIIQETVKSILAEWGQIDVLVNNAAMAEVLPFPLIEEEDWDNLIDINLKGTFFATKAVVRHFITRKRGNIVNVGSIAGERVMEAPAHYAASKSAMSGFTFSLAKELGRYNVRVNSVVPGLIEGGVSVKVPQKQKDQYVNYCSLSRLGNVDEVANVIAFIASEKSSYINGQRIFVDGGI